MIFSHSGNRASHATNHSYLFYTEARIKMLKQRIKTDIVQIKKIMISQIV